MWTKHYKDYIEDASLKKYSLRPGEIVGCEMNELFGWGNTLHISEQERKLVKKEVKK